MPEDIPVGAPVSLEFLTTIDSCVLYTHKDRRFTENINVDTSSTRAQLFRIIICVYYIPHLQQPYGVSRIIIKIKVIIINNTGDVCIDYASKDCCRLDEMT